MVDCGEDNYSDNGKQCYAGDNERKRAFGFGEGNKFSALARDFSLELVEL